MNTGIISMRYARALMEYAKETKTEDLFYGSLRLLLANLMKQPELERALNNPILPRAEKVKLVCVAASGKESIGKEFESFVNLVLKNDREHVLPFICMSYIHLYRDYRHMAVAKVTTAVPLAKATEERLAKIASQKLHAQVEIENVVNPDIIGGLVFDINDYRIDASIKAKLKSIERQLLDKNKRIV